MRPDFSTLCPCRQCPDPRLAKRRILPHRLACAHAEHTCALDQHEIGASKPDAAGEADDKDARAKGDTAQAVLENLATDRIEHHIRAAAVGDALDGVTKRL